MKHVYLSITALFIASAYVTDSYAGHGGAAAGGFFGGLAVGSILTSAAQRSNYRSDRDYIAALEEENAELRAELRRCQRKLRRS